MYLSTAAAAKLIKGAMRGKTAAARREASDGVIAQLSRIASDPSVPFEAFRAQYLRDCLELGEPARAQVFLEQTSFSANDKRDLLEVAVALYLAMGKTKLATDWIAEVSYVFGAKVVSGLAAKPGFAALAKNKAYLEVAGKDAPRNFFVAHLADATRMWKRGEYDHWKDAVQDAKGLVKEAAPLGAQSRASADKHLAAVVKRVAKESANDPGLKRILKGLM